MMNLKAFIFTGVLGLSAGCSLTPKYERPETPVPADWPEGSAYDAHPSSAEIPQATGIDWQNYFGDDRLIQIIALALDNNRDLRIAALNVQKVRTLYGIKRADLFPTMNLSAGGSKQSMSGARFGNAGDSFEVEQYNVDLGVSSWEIDFFGRLRSLKEQALEDYLATEEAARSTQISLVFEVANTYLTLAADREILQLAQTTYETQKKAYELIQQRYDVGIANELDVRRAQTQMESARVDINRYTQTTAQDLNTLNLLVGTTAPVPEKLLPANLECIDPPQTVDAGLPSEVLLNRPDILAAEHRLKATYANLGAARAAFFPRISLTATFGTASGDLTKLFHSGMETWNYAPQIVMPIFDSRLRSALEASKAEREIMITQYERTIQTAFREVADALAVQGTVNEQIAAQQSLVDALAKTYELSDMRYTKGIDSYLSVLDAQRSLYAAQQAMVMLRLTKYINQARLYAVLGGGS